ncbi:hypothetical protein DQ238_12055 [Geodermatophilus sp. TF02-6]|uniref:hypothetical protein n=1 Tax=Geodermatophilus sp. TF02-6 TaxID=2250575 RepID=UPI000DEB492F|nr:hypothetical protein [Geodermatophilus sp. TF02-6]RBY78785.1 hypothetical protein DQ238_12055 [Geodermatophilus sp. TF02-6]
MAGRLRRRVVAVPALLLQGLGVLAVVLAAVRAVWFAIWAAGAESADLATSWGGPTAIGATLVHGAVAALLAAAGAGLVLLGRRLRRP